MMTELIAALRALGGAAADARHHPGRQRAGVLRRARPARDDRPRPHRLSPDLRRLHAADDRRSRTIPQPVIARVHGIATAAGCQLVATCDLAVAARGGALRDAGREDRPLLHHADGGADARRRPQARDGDAAHRRRRSTRAPRPSGDWSTASSPPSQLDEATQRARRADRRRQRAHRRASASRRSTPRSTSTSRRPTPTPRK